ncbi:MAG TPA: hypothetical protein VH253_03940, partial [Phycisphaerae bacterium]|nr:hypothetical protein [Phycisphaerae bacterium]
MITPTQRAPAQFTQTPKTPPTRRLRKKDEHLERLTPTPTNSPTYENRKMSALPPALSALPRFLVHFSFDIRHLAFGIRPSPRTAISPLPTRSSLSK